MSEFGASSTGARFGCPKCGGGLKYDIASGKMICDRCGEKTEVSALQDAAPEAEMMDITEFHCPQCGAMIYSTDTSATGFCSFCGSDVVLTGKLGKTRRPASIVPFTISREECEAKYREHLGHYHLMPKELKAAETISHFRPVYVPFWSYHVESSGEASLVGHKSYTKGDYRYTEEYDLSMHADIDQRGILYDASTAFEDETAAMLQHTASKAIPFHSAYLSGLYAQAADVPAETYEDEAAASAVRMFMEKVKDEYEMDSVEMKGNIKSAFGLPHARFEKELTMMPVWLLAHRQGTRVLYTAVNGRDGKVVCDVPVSNGKISGVTAVLSAILFVLLWLFLTVKPDLLMVFCSLLLLTTQFLFSGAHKTLNNRRTRAFEPDFSSGSATFTGPAQMMLDRKGNKIALNQSKIEKQLAKGGKIISTVLIALCVVAYAVLDDKISLSQLSGSGGRTLMLLAMGIMFIIMLVHLISKGKKAGSGPLFPRVLSCIACGAGVLFLLTGQHEDLLYYACAAVMLVAAIWELGVITRAHNEYASRPVPFFEEESA